MFTLSSGSNFYTYYFFIRSIIDNKLHLRCIYSLQVFLYKANLSEYMKEYIVYVGNVHEYDTRQR